jgi:hypothetical protein
VTRPGLDADDLRRFDPNRGAAVERGRDGLCDGALPFQSLVDGLEHALRRTKGNEHTEGVFDFATAAVVRAGIAPLRPREASLCAVDLGVLRRGVARDVAREQRACKGCVARSRCVGVVGCGAVEVQGFGRVLIATLDSPDTLQNPRGRGVKKDRAASGAFAQGASLDGFGERKRLGPRRQCFFARPDGARTRDVAGFDPPRPGVRLGARGSSALGTAARRRR